MSLFHISVGKAYKKEPMTQYELRSGSQPCASNNNASSSSAQLPQQTLAAEAPATNPMWTAIYGEDALPYVSSSNASSSSAQVHHQTPEAEAGVVLISAASLGCFL